MFRSNRRGYSADMHEAAPAASTRPRRRTTIAPLRRVAIATAAGLLVVPACSSDAGGDDDRPADVGTVLPPDDIGAGGGVPVDNLDPDVADQSRQDADDVDGDGDAEP